MSGLERQPIRVRVDEGRWPVALVVFEGEVNPPNSVVTEDWQSVVEVFERHEGACAAVLDSAAAGEGPNAHVRQQGRRTLESVVALRDLDFRGLAIVDERRILRAALTGVFWLIESRFPVRFFANRFDAMVWARSLVGE